MMTTHDVDRAELTIFTGGRSAGERKGQEGREGGGEIRGKRREEQREREREKGNGRIVLGSREE